MVESFHDAYLSKQLGKKEEWNELNDEPSDLIILVLIVQLHMDLCR